MKKTSVSIAVNYSHSLEEVINAGGYSWEDDFLPRPIHGKVEMSAELFHFNRSMSSKESVAQMYKLGYRPATLSELLALGDVYCDLKQESPVVALSPVWHHKAGHLLVSVLSLINGKRRIITDRFSGDWTEACHFLGLRR